MEKNVCSVLKRRWINSDVTAWQQTDELNRRPGLSKASPGPGAINNTGPCAGVASQGQEGASAPLKYYSAPPSESSFLPAVLEAWAPGAYPGYPPLEGTADGHRKYSEVRGVSAGKATKLEGMKSCYTS